jgi:hypothetical protein
MAAASSVPAPLEAKQREEITSSSVDLENKTWQITQWHDPAWNCGRYNCNFCGNIEGRKEFEQKLKTETIEELKMIRDMLVTNMMISETTAIWDSWDELEEVENKKIGF